MSVLKYLTYQIKRVEEFLDLIINTIVIPMTTMFTFACLSGVCLIILSSIEVEFSGFQFSLYIDLEVWGECTAITESIGQSGRAKSTSADKRK